MSTGCLFEDRFVIRQIDSSKFENVSRLRAKSTGFDAEIVVDVNTQLFHVNEKESLFIGISNSATEGGKGERGTAERWENSENSIINEYDYVMYGTIFHFEDKTSELRTFYASFGGLMMALTAPKQALGDLKIDTRIYLLVKRSDDVTS